MVLPRGVTQPVPQLFNSSGARTMPPRADEPLLPRANQVTTPVAPAATGDTGGTGFLSEIERALAAGNPAYAIAMIRRAKTGGKMDMSGAGDFREAMLGDALQSYLAMQMPSSTDADGTMHFNGDPIGQASQGLADIVAGSTSGHGFGGVLRGQAASLLGQDFSGLKDNQIAMMLAAAADTAGLGYGKFASFAPQNAYDLLNNEQMQNSLAGGTTNVLGQPGALDTFKALLQRYLGTT